MPRPVELGACGPREDDNCRGWKVRNPSSLDNVILHICLPVVVVLVVARDMVLVQLAVGCCGVSVQMCVCVQWRRFGRLDRAARKLNFKAQAFGNLLGVKIQICLQKWTQRRPLFVAPVRPFSCQLFGELAPHTHTLDQRETICSVRS